MSRDLEQNETENGLENREKANIDRISNNIPAAIGRKEAIRDNHSLIILPGIIPQKLVCKGGYCYGKLA
mgnify:CR=1 FL=1